MPTHRPGKGANCRGARVGYWLRRTVRFGFIPVVAVSMGFFAGCDNDAEIVAPRPPLVSVVTPQVREIAPWDVYPGRLVAIPTVQIRARVSGFIEEAPFEEGAIVQEGDLLYVIDPRPFEVELKQAEAQVAQAQARFKFAQSDFERIQAIRASNAVSEVEFFRAQQEMESAQAAVAAAQAAVEAAKLNLSWSRVTAPITGRVGHQEASLGNLVTGGAQQATLLTTITALDPIYCYVAVDERTVRHYQQMVQEGRLESVAGGRLTAQLALGTDGQFEREGYIDFVDNQVDPQTGTLTARGVFDNPDGRLIAGFYARLRVPSGDPRPMTLVPEQAIGAMLAQEHVLVVDQDNIVQQHPVKTGAVYDGLREVEGISPDARVVVRGLVQARPGQPVRVEEITIEEVLADSIALTRPVSAEVPADSDVGQSPSRSADGPAEQPDTPGSRIGGGGLEGGGQSAPGDRGGDPQ